MGTGADVANTDEPDKPAKRPDRATRRANADRARIEAGVAEGGLAVYETDGTLFHYTPPDLASSLRFLLARLQRTDEVHVGSTIAVTSALEGEGVTSVSRGLAAIMAHDLDRSICLLETNWWDPPPSTNGKGEPRPGLADVLTGARRIDEVIVRTEEPRLAVVSAGRLPVGDRPAMVSSAAYGEMLKMLTKVFDTVVIDAPPVLKASEATTIVRQAEAAVVVVRHGVTTERQLGSAIDELGGTTLLGVVVNRSSTRLPKFLRRFTAPT